MSKTKRFFVLAMAAILVLAGTCFAASAPYKGKADNETSLHVINVNTDLAGENDCTALAVLIKHKGKNILIDTGITYPSSNEKVKRYLKSVGVKKIDHLIITHFHSDHVGGFMTVAENFDIGTVYYKMTSLLLSTKTFKRQMYDDVFLSIKYKVNSDGGYPVVIQPAEEGYKVILDNETYFELYNCTDMFDEENIGYDANFYSMTVNFVHGGAKAFIGGDAGDVNDGYIIGNVGHVDVFVLEHHGADLPYNSQAIFEELTPVYSVATCYRWDETVPGFNNVIYLPGKGVYERAASVGSTVILTGELGDIVFDSNGTDFALRNNI